MHFFNLFEYNLYDTAKIQYCTYVVYTQVCEWTMPSSHNFNLLLTCLPTYIRMWPDYGKLTKLSHLLFQRIATDFKNLMVVSKA